LLVDRVQSPPGPLCGDAIQIHAPPPTLRIPRPARPTIPALPNAAQPLATAEPVLRPPPPASHSPVQYGDARTLRIPLRASLTASDIPPSDPSLAFNLLGRCASVLLRPGQSAGGGCAIHLVFSGNHGPE